MSANEPREEHMDGKASVDEATMEELSRLLYEVATAIRFEHAKDARAAMRRAAELNSSVQRVLEGAEAIERPVVAMYLDFLATLVPVQLNLDEETNAAWAELWESLWVIT